MAKYSFTRLAFISASLHAPGWRASFVDRLEVRFLIAHFRFLNGRCNGLSGGLVGPANGTQLPLALLRFATG
jgi:hypothetical protein